MFATLKLVIVLVCLEAYDENFTVLNQSSICGDNLKDLSEATKMIKSK